MNVHRLYRAQSSGTCNFLQERALGSTLFSNLSKSGLDNYVVKHYDHPILEEVARSRLKTTDGSSYSKGSP